MDPSKFLQSIKEALNNKQPIAIPFTCDRKEECYLKETYGWDQNTICDNTVYIYAHEKVKIPKNTLKHQEGITVNGLKLLKKNHHTKTDERLKQKVWLRVEIGIDVFNHKHPYAATMQIDDFILSLMEKTLSEKLHFYCECISKQMIEYLF